MKKYIAYVLSVMLMCTILSGCGRSNMENDKIINTPIIDMNTNTDNGVVTDKDGIIDDDKDKETVTDNSGTGTQSGNSSKTSPSPEATIKP